MRKTQSTHERNARLMTRRPRGGAQDEGVHRTQGRRLISGAPALGPGRGPCPGPGHRQRGPALGGGTGPRRCPPSPPCLLCHLHVFVVVVFLRDKTYKREALLDFSSLNLFFQ